MITFFQSSDNRLQVFYLSRKLIQTFSPALIFESSAPFKSIDILVNGCRDILNLPGERVVVVFVLLNTERELFDNHHKITGTARFLKFYDG